MKKCSKNIRNKKFLLLRFRRVHPFVIGGTGLYNKTSKKNCKKYLEIKNRWNTMIDSEIKCAYANINKYN